VDLLKIIQLGLTFLDSRGHMPEGVTTWQFNFRSALALTSDLIST
jgi:CCR4-NOT transcription complex subunit 7/8